MHAKYTIEFNSGGNHGHQLKDYLGGRTIGEFFNLEYIATPHKYLKQFGIEENKRKISKWKRRFFFNKIIRIKGPFWNGFEEIDDFQNKIGHLIAPQEESTLYIFEKALRLHPCQTIAWKKSNKISIDIFSAIIAKTSEDYLSQENNTFQTKSKISVAIHINRGEDFDKLKYPDHFESSNNVRYMFSMDYYERIIYHLNSNYGAENLDINIYTEALNSEEIVSTFNQRKEITLHVGSNRSNNNQILISKIFNEFVHSDILVCSNSSFSSVAVHFRFGKTSIYYPHKHLYNLPTPDFISTSENGDFDTSLLPKG